MSVKSHVHRLPRPSTSRLKGTRAESERPRVAASLEQWRAGGVRFTTSDEVVG